MSRQALWRVARLIYVVLVATFLAWALFDARASLQDWREWLGTPGVYAFVLAWMAMAALLGFAWARVLRGYFGLGLGVREWLPIQAAAWVGRYLPGKIGLLAGKLPLLQREGIDWRGLGYSVLFEQLAFVVTGIAVAVVVPLPMDRFDIVWLSSLGGGAPALRACIAAAMLALFVALATVMARKLRTPARPRWSVWLLILATYLLAHAMVGGGLHLFLQARLAGGAMPDLAYVIGLLAFANIAGILAVFAPAGIGVRDVIIAAGLTPWLAFDQALAVAASLRILTLIADLAFFVVAGGLSRLRNQKAVA